MRHFWLGFCALGVLFASLAFASEPRAVPALSGRIVDQVGLLDAATRAQLERQLAEFEQRKGAQIAVLIVGSTAPEEIEQYAIRVVDAWALGRKGVDDGALLLVASDDRRLRIEVGRGLEGALTDLTANRIIVEIIRPRFAQGDYAGGISEGLARMIGVIEGEPLPQPAGRSAGGAATDNGDLAGLLILAALFVSMLLVSMFGRLFGALLAGSLAGAGTFLFVGSVLAALGSLLAVFVIALVLGSQGVGAVLGGLGRGRRGGGGFGGGGFGGGGFRGGGGGFGGGGASGRW